MNEKSTAALAGGIVAAAIVLGHRGGASRRAMGGSVGESHQIIRIRAQRA